MTRVNPWNGYSPTNASDRARLDNLNRQVNNSANNAGSITPWSGFSPTNGVDRQRLVNEARHAQNAHRPHHGR